MFYNIEDIKKIIKLREFISTESDLLLKRSMQHELANIIKGGSDSGTNEKIIYDKSTDNSIHRL